MVDYLEKRNQKLVAKAPTLLTSRYRPEIDVTAELDATDASYYHLLIGILCWIVELGCIDITSEISMMSSHLALPREGDLEEVLHAFAYLKKHMNLEIFFDPKTTEVDMDIFQKQDWSFFVYSSTGEELKEELPPNMPEPLCLPFVMRVYVYSDHAGESVTTVMK